MNENTRLLHEYIRQQVSLTGSAPTFSQMAANMGNVSKQTIEDWLQILESQGLIIRKGTTQRKIFLTEIGQKTPVTSIKANSYIGLESTHSKIYTSPSVGTSYIPTDANNSLSTQGIKLEVNIIDLILKKGGEQNGTT